uniref:Uncharacterized protein n=1 Tax=Fagus sylvatica TaxID=28930 RepID=A0A2N9HL13_FAGSY
MDSDIEESLKKRQRRTPLDSTSRKFEQLAARPFVMGEVGDLEFHFQHFCHPVGYAMWGVEFIIVLGRWLPGLGKYGT